MQRGVYIVWDNIPVLWELVCSAVFPYSPWKSYTETHFGTTCWSYLQVSSSLAALHHGMTLVTELS